MTPALPWLPSLYAILPSIGLNEIEARRLRLAGRVDSDDAPDVAATAGPETALLDRQVIAAVEALPPDAALGDAAAAVRRGARLLGDRCGPHRAAAPGRALAAPRDHLPRDVLARDGH